MTTLKQHVKNIGLTRYRRVKRYTQNLQENITVKNKKDKKTLEEINIIIDDRITRIRRLHVVNVLLYAFVYFSFISFLFTDIIFLSEITRVYTQLMNLVGTTIFIIIIFFIRKVIELYYQDLTLLSAHIISIYNDHPIGKHVDLFEIFNVTK